MGTKTVTFVWCDDCKTETPVRDADGWVDVVLTLPPTLQEELGLGNLGSQVKLSFCPTCAPRRLASLKQEDGR